MVGSDRYAGIVALAILTLAGVIVSVVIGLYADWQAWDNWVLLHFGACPDTTPVVLADCQVTRRVELLQMLEGWLIAFEILVVIAMTSPVAVRFGSDR